MIEMKEKIQKLAAIATQNIQTLQSQGAVVKKMFEDASRDAFEINQEFVNLLVESEKEIASLKQENETLKVSLKAFEKDVKKPKPAPKKTPKSAKA